MGGEKGEMETNHERLLKIENELRFDGRRWVGDGLDNSLAGIKEGPCSDEQWVIFLSDKSLNCIPETYIALYVN